MIDAAGAFGARECVSLARPGRFVASAEQTGEDGPSGPTRGATENSGTVLSEMADSTVLTDGPGGGVDVVAGVPG